MPWETEEIYTESPAEAEERRYWDEFTHLSLRDLREMQERERDEEPVDLGPRCPVVQARLSVTRATNTPEGRPRRASRTILFQSPANLTYRNSFLVNAVAA